MIKPIKFEKLYKEIVGDSTQNVTYEKLYCFFKKKLIEHLFIGGFYCSSGSYYYKNDKYCIRVSNHPHSGYLKTPTLSFVLKKELRKHNYIPHHLRLECTEQIYLVKNKTLLEAKKILRKIVKEINYIINDFLLKYHLL